jgi:hypothetical protein
MVLDQARPFLDRTCLQATALETTFGLASAFSQPHRMTGKPLSSVTALV